MTMKNKHIGTLFIFIFINQCTVSPLNRSQVALYSDEKMAVQGNEIYNEIKKSTPISANSEKVKYVECITGLLLRGLDDPQRFRHEWEVSVFEDSQANAFALSGGKIGVYVGLLEIADNQHQLAAVIAHEIGHVLARHGNERLTQTTMRNVGLLAAQVLGVSDSTIAAIDASTQLGLILPFSRTQESEADNIGLRLMAETGFDPIESVVLWENMANNRSENPPELLSTHPSPESRIKTLRTLMASAEKSWVSARQSGKNPDCAIAS